MSRIDNNFNNLNYNNRVKEVVISFFESFYNSDRLKLYSYLDTSFQKEVPLNYFLIHSDYDIDLGKLLNVNKIVVEKEKNIASCECIIELQNKRREMVVALRSDFGGWKIEGESIFNRGF